MDYQIEFLSGQRVAVFNLTTNTLLPFVYNTIREFMLFVVLNNNQLIFDQNQYNNIWNIYEDKYFCEEDTPEVIELIKTYKCSEVSLDQIRCNIPNATFVYDNKSFLNFLKSL